MRDLGALERAIARPQIGYYESLIEEASALMESLAMNRPFVGGKKRVAFFATATFLRLNGWFIECDSREAHSFFIQLFETNTFRFSELKAWLEDHVKPLPASG